MDKEHIYEDFCERLENELCDQYKKVEGSKQMSPSDLEITDTLAHTIKSLKTIMAMDEKYYDRYSGTRMYPDDRDYRSRVSYSGRRDSNGRYSRDSEKEDMIRHLEGMMNNVRTDDEAVSIRNAIDAVSRIR